MSTPVIRPALLVADRWRDYALLDGGEGMKQERWGEFTLVRPDPQIIWPRHQLPAGARWENRCFWTDLLGNFWLYGGARDSTFSFLLNTNLSYV